ncbi:MAG: RecQ family ATP-dependent DNA helicase [Coriobacteriia bacterium]
MESTEQFKLTCPECGRPMVKRPNRSTGVMFWGCSGWPEYKHGTLSVEAVEELREEWVRARPKLDSEGQPIAPIYRHGWRWGRRFEVEPLRPDHRSQHFQAHVVRDDAHFREFLKGEKGYWPHLGQFRVEHQTFAVPDHQPAVAATLSVVEKILFRGRVMPAPTSWPLVSDAGMPADLSQACSGWSLRLRSLESESPAEMHLAKHHLAEWLGSLWTVWVTPQVHMSSLIATKEYQNSEQRVDMLIAHPFLSRPIVIEVDGAAYHHDRTAADAKRDACLREAGYEVHRIPASEVFADAGSALESLRSALAHLRVLEPQLGADLNDATRRMGQIQAALWCGLRDGVFSMTSSGPTRIWCDVGDRLPHLAEAAESAVLDFVELVRDVAALYGLEAFAAGWTYGQLQQSDANAAQVIFFDEEVARFSIHVDDICVPWDVSWESADATPQLPCRVDRDVVRRLMARVFAKEDFYEGQWEILSAGLRGEDTIALLPTGGGKSIAFQLTAILVPGCAVVVAPLISLIRDQQANLLQYGIDRVAAITGELSSLSDRKAVHAALRSGVVLFCYVAPERFQIKLFRDSLRDMTARNPVNYIVVDEAHCVSEWGIEFRTSYLRLGAITRRECGRARWTPTLLALTGTASHSVLKDVKRELAIDGDPIRPSQLGRDELKLEVIACDTSEKAIELEALLSERIPGFFGTDEDTLLAREKPPSDDVPYQGVIFCLHVNGDYGVKRLADRLSKTGTDVRMHSSDPPKDFAGSEKRWDQLRRRTEVDFKYDRFPLLVATKAYGMGVDKPDIRYTVHYGMPPSIESFYQEVGRAGRDRDPAYCVMLLSENDGAGNDWILQDAPLQAAADRVRKTRYADRDDIDRCLYFHTTSFPGVDVELERFGEVLGLLGEFWVRGMRTLRREIELKKDSAFQKAIHRLTVLSVIRDYTLDWNDNSYELDVGMESRQAVAQSLAAYVASYSQDRANMMLPQFLEDAGREDLDETAFVLLMARHYLEFLYEIVETGRRSAIFEMLLAARSPDPEAFDHRVRVYLQSTDYGRRLEVLLELPDAGLAEVATLVADHVGPAGADGARGESGRMLEAYPDHPALLLLRGIAEERSRDGDAETAYRFVRRAIENAAVLYGVSTTAFVDAVVTAFRVFADSSTEQARRILARAVELKRSDRDALRLLVERLGPEPADVAAYALLLDDIGALVGASSVHRAATIGRTE